MFIDRSDSIRPNSALDSPHAGVILVGETPVRSDFNEYMMKDADEEDLGKLVKRGLQAIIPDFARLFGADSATDPLENTPYRTNPPPRTKHHASKIRRQNRQGAIKLTDED